MGNHVLHTRELHKAVNLKKPGDNKKAKALWTLKGAKDKGTGYFDLSSVQQIETRSKVRLALWEIYMRSPTAALEEALKRTEDSMG